MSVSDPIAPHYKQEDIPPNQLMSKIKFKNVKINKILLPIIMYHYVENVVDKKDTIRMSLNINPYMFEQQLKTITEAGYTSYFVRDVPSIMDGKIKAPEKSVVLTFDDGYEDFYTYALPLLKKYNVKATIYIIVDFIGRKGFLNEQEIKDIASSGLVEIGSHTLDHAYLKKAQPKYAIAQIVDSKKELESKFNIKVDTFAYPYGAFDEAAIDMVKQASYSAAVSTIPGTEQTQENLFFLYRMRAGYIEGRNALQVLATAKP